jgi:nitrogen fixation protein FixH
MAPTSIGTWIWERRWPIGLQVMMAVTIGANAVLLFLATRPDASRPLPDWYERAVDWDETQAIQESSRALGWVATWDVPTGAEYTQGMPRPVDLVLKDRHGRPITGLVGQVRAVRPADAALDNEAEIVELPQAPGSYRCLLRFAADGLWELDATVRQGELTWVDSHRLDIDSEQEAM